MGFFKQDLFSPERVLTSKGIQERYFEAIKRRKETSEYPYILVNVCNNGVNVDKNSINVDINTQSKVKYIKKPPKGGKESDLNPIILDKPIQECYEEFLLIAPG